MGFVKTAELLLRADALLAEGPVWNEQSQRLYWVDILKHSIHCWEANSGKTTAMELKEYPSTIALEPDGKLIVTAKKEIFRVRFDQKMAELLLTIPEESAVDTRFNDGKPDPAGRLWAGTMALDQSSPKKVGAGKLYCIGPKQSVTPVLNGTTISNGLCWRGNAFYFVDTPTQSVCRYTIDKTTGELDAPQVCVRIPAEDGSPDGMTIDRDGMLWVAQWGGSQVGCYNPRTGEKLGAITVPDKYVSCCTFGGESMNTLFITTAREDDPNGGNLYQITLDTAGEYANRCRAFGG